MSEFPAVRATQCATCWGRQFCEANGFANCWGYRREPRCPDHPDKPLVSLSGHRAYHCPECGVSVCWACGLASDALEAKVNWSTGLCHTCSRHRDEARQLHAKRVAQAVSDFAWAADNILSAKTEWELAVRLADLAEKRRELREADEGE